MSVKFALTLLAVTMFMTACRQAEVARQLTTDTEAITRTGLEEQQLFAKFGHPKSIREFPMSEALSMFRARLQSHYPLPENGSVRIRELTWELPNNVLLTVWLHQSKGIWRALESTRYDKWTVF